MHILVRAAAICVLFAAGAASAKDYVVKVDARAMPWQTAMNPKLRFGMANGRPPAVLMSPLLLSGRTINITATGRTTTYGPESFGPEGVLEWTADVGAAIFPSYHMPKKERAIHLNELVGAFIDADGKVVGKPFPIGAEAKLSVPDGAIALSMGLNDDNFSDNTGSLMVTVSIGEPKVIVEPSEDKAVR